MSIRDWPEAERPREKLLEQGAAALSDAELLAIFLRTGVTGCSAVELSRRLLSEFGGLRALLEADLASFCGHLGLGVAKYAQLQAVLEMGRRHLAERLRRDSILESPQAVRDYLKARLRHEQHEVFACLFLDTRHRVLAFEVLFNGLAFSNNLIEVAKRAKAPHSSDWGPDGARTNEKAHTGRISSFWCSHVNGMRKTLLWGFIIGLRKVLIF